jgi:thiol-disulfide isomerase/thioredoxin
MRFADIIPFLIFPLADAGFFGTDAVNILTPAQFESELLQKNEGSKDNYKLVMMFANWCGHCKLLSPYVGQTAAAYQGESKISFNAIDCALNDENARFCGGQGVWSFPVIRIYKDTVVVKDKLDARPYVLMEYIDSLIGTKKATEALALGSVGQTEKAEVVLADDYISYAYDAVLTLFTLMRRQVFKDETELTGEKLENVRRLLSICETLKAPAMVYDQCHYILENLSPVALPRQNWTDTAISFIPPSVKYLSCRDLSCGMWRLLHLTTFSRPAETAMDDVRFLVDNYFPCEVCRAHFLQHYDTCDFNRCAPGENPVVWLWRVHNGVDARVGNPTLDIEESQVVPVLSAKFGVGMYIPNPPGGSHEPPGQPHAEL